MSAVERAERAASLYLSEAGTLHRGDCRFAVYARGRRVEAVELLAMDDRREYYNVCQACCPADPQRERWDRQAAEYRARHEAADRARRALAGTLVRSPSGRVHRVECPNVSDQALITAEPPRAGDTPCRACEPPGYGFAPKPPRRVWVTAGGLRPHHVGLDLDGIGVVRTIMFDADGASIETTAGAIFHRAASDRLWYFAERASR